MQVQFLSTYVLFWKLAFCKEVIIWTLRPPTASKLKRRSSYFFILVLYTKFHSNPMMGTPSNSNFLSWNLAFSINFCCGRKKPKTTNALFEWFRLKIKGATLETNSCFLKMIIINFFSDPKSAVLTWSNQKIAIFSNTRCARKKVPIVMALGKCSLYLMRKWKLCYAKWFQNQVSLNV